MEPKGEIGLSSQRTEDRRSQKFGLGAAQNRNVQSHGQIRSNCLWRSRDELPSARDSNASIASAVKCISLLGYDLL